MKCVGMQYLETIRRYINEKLTFDRTIHVSFMPGNWLVLFLIIVLPTLLIAVSIVL